MEGWEWVNCCKTPGCRQFGRVNSACYQRTGQNQRCPECGYSFPLISPLALRDYAQYCLQPLRDAMISCPACQAVGALRQQGQTATGKLRWRCQRCRALFSLSPQQHQVQRLMSLQGAIAAGDRLHSLSGGSTALGRGLRHLAFSAAQRRVHQQVRALDAEFSTLTFPLPFNGSQSQLYIIVTADNKQGDVVALSSNYVVGKTGLSPEWLYRSRLAEMGDSRCVAQSVFAKDRMISRRQTYFDIDYGPAFLRSNDPGTLVKPVLAAYHHFALLQLLTRQHVLSTQHWLEQECFLYGGVLMANRQAIVEGRCQIGFVREQGERDRERRLRHDVFVSDIIWQDRWHHYTQRHYELAVCSLVGAVSLKATLKPAQTFRRYVQEHAIWPQLIRMTPANVVHLLEHLAGEFNRNHQ